MAVEYPNQVSCEWGNQVQINDDMHFTPAKEADGTPPMQINADWNRFRVTILDLSAPGKPKSCVANIPWKEISPISRKTDWIGAYRVAHAMECGSASSTESLPTTPAYTAKLRYGEFKDMTPAQILANPENKTKLLETRSNLEKNLERYPVNRSTIAAIDEAIRLLEASELKAAGTPTPVTDGTYTIYERKFKYMRPIINGKYTIYNITISCNTGNMQYPYRIYIGNCMAPVNKTAKGTTLPDMSQAVDKKGASINLSEDSFIEFIDVMYRRLWQFEQTHFKEQEEVLKRIAWKPAAPATSSSGEPITKQLQAQEGHVTMTSYQNGDVTLAV